MKIKLPRYRKDGSLFPNSDFTKDTAYKKVDLSSARKCGPTVHINSIRKVNNSKEALIEKGHVYIKDIFLDAWEDFKIRYAHLLTRPEIIENIERFLNCGNIDNGFLYFECKDGCGSHIQPFTCKSRFCPKCGKKYRDRTSANIAKKLVKKPHRQFVFTVPEEYRLIMRKYRYLLNTLFDTVNESLNLLIGNNKGIAKKEARKLGFISFLHTFGRDMKWNPHIHLLIAECYINNKNEIKKYDYFHFERLRKIFMYKLSTNFYNALKENNASKKDITDLYKLNNELKKIYTSGFYIYGPKLKNHSLSSMKAIANYITRYASHPAISQSRIVKYDSTTKKVTWYYDPHEDDNIEEEDDKLGRQYVTEHAFDFIKRLIIHIPEKHFPLIRYYGFYSSKFKIQDVEGIVMLFTEKQIKNMIYDTIWVRYLINVFGYTPLLCNICGGRMTLNLDKSEFPNRKGGASP